MARWGWAALGAVVIAAAATWVIADVALSTTPPRLGSTVVVTLAPQHGPPGPTDSPSPQSTGAVTVPPAPPPSAGDDDDDDDD